VPLLEEIRSGCAEIAARARWVRIDIDALSDAATEIAGGGAEQTAPALDPTTGHHDRQTAPALDPVRHYLEGEPADVADYLFALDAVNFGSGWFPTLNKRLDGGHPVSGYFTVAWALADHVRGNGPPTPAWLRGVDTRTIARILDQPPDHELMSLYAQALRELGRFLGGRRALEVVAQCEGSAERLAQTLARGMAMFDDRGFYKRAQILPSDLALAGVAELADLDRLTIFADNLVPHVLRCEGVLVYEEQLAARIDAGELLPAGGPEREIRACAVHACELISERTGIPPRVLDARLWNRGQASKYKQRPRHRCRTVFY
jgi:Potential Queuosine, Q, salvage protein family